jgi:hypothetical protein
VASQERTRSCISTDSICQLTVAILRLVIDALARRLGEKPQSQDCRLPAQIEPAVFPQDADPRPVDRRAQQSHRLVSVTYNIMAPEDNGIHRSTYTGTLTCYAVDCNPQCSRLVELAPFIRSGITEVLIPFG